MRRMIVSHSLVTRLSAAMAMAAAAAHADPVVVSGPAFAACTIGGPGTNYVNAEVEPWLSVNPANPMNMIGVWQQDRWSNGGAHAVAGYTFDGGATSAHAAAVQRMRAGRPSTSARPIRGSRSGRTAPRTRCRFRSTSRTTAMRLPRRFRPTAGRRGAARPC